MENERITRDTDKQKKFKDELKEESKKYYGVEKCYASHKPYKGLIASHIKPYKICVLEGDEDSQFDINNGLLLAKAIDDYFDKFELTFDINGRIIFSDSIPEEIKEEFSEYYLEDFIYNKKRKNYMNIHRSIFFYKNYYHKEIIKIKSTDNLERFNLPYLDCGIKLYRDKIIVLKNDRWELCSLYKSKSEFIERTQSLYDLSFYISSADLYNKMNQEKKYLLNEIPNGFNCLSSTVLFDEENKIVKENAFKISSANYNLQEGIPQRFISLLEKIFNDEKYIKYFRKIINIAIKGKGFSKGVLFYGDLDSIEYLLEILRKVFGSYYYEDVNTKKISKTKVTSESIPNCCILVIRINNEAIEKNTIDKLLSNDYFVKTILNHEQYIPFYIAEKNGVSIDNTLKFQLKGLLEKYNIDEIIEQEGSMILNWFINIDEEIDLDLSDNKILSNTKKTSVINWLNDNCIIIDDYSLKISATELYENYIEYMKKSNEEALSDKMFFRILSKYVSKKRYGSGVFYLGIKFK